MKRSVDRGDSTDSMRCLLKFSTGKSFSYADHLVSNLTLGFHML